jgi:hypothetical protein
MSYIFKKFCQDETNLRNFGICDDKLHQRAYIHTGHGGNWTAVVQNDNQYDVTFTALDHCIEIRNSKGKMQSRCEGIITYNNTIIFIEIKQRTGDAKTWAKDADKQLRSTISVVSAKINLNLFVVKKAAIANPLHRRSAEKHTTRMMKFLDDTGYILIVNYRIVLD